MFSCLLNLSGYVWCKQRILIYVIEKQSVCNHNTNKFAVRFIQPSLDVKSFAINHLYEDDPLDRTTIYCIPCILHFLLLFIRWVVLNLVKAQMDIALPGQIIPWILFLTKFHPFIWLFDVHNTNIRKCSFPSYTCSCKPSFRIWNTQCPLCSKDVIFPVLLPG